MARPYKLDKARVDKLVKNIKLGVTLDTAARASGLGPATFYRYKQDALAVANNVESVTKNFTPEYIEILEYFLEQIQQADAEAEIAIVEKMQKAIDEGAWQAGKFILQARFGWRIQQEVIHRADENGLGTVKQLKDVSQMSTAELEALVQSQNTALDTGTIEGEIIDSE
jgi:AcrR family transcriptional regulator